MSKVRNALLLFQNASMLRKVEIISIYKTSGSLPWYGGVIGLAYTMERQVVSGKTEVS